MKIAKKLDRIPFWAWPFMGGTAGTVVGGAINFGHLIARVLS